MSDHNLSGSSSLPKSDPESSRPSSDDNWDSFAFRINKIIV